MMIYLIHWIFYIYTILLAVRIVGSWFPRVAASRPMGYLALFIDPYLNLFRRWIPPIGGTLDLSPLLGYFVLQIMERVVLSAFQ